MAYLLLHTLPYKSQRMTASWMRVPHEHPIKKALTMEGFLRISSPVKHGDEDNVLRNLQNVL